MRPFKSCFRLGCLLAAMVPFDVGAGSFTGRWEGITDNDRAIALTVDADDVVTAIELEYRPPNLACAMAFSVPLDTAVAADGSFSAPRFCINQAGNRLCSSLSGVFETTCGPSGGGQLNIDEVRINCSGTYGLGNPPTLAFEVTRQGGDPWPCVAITPDEITDSEPVDLEIRVDFPAGGLLGASATYNGVDILGLLLPFVTGVTATSAQISIPGLAFPENLAALFQLSIDTSAGPASDQLPIDTAAPAPPLDGDWLGLLPGGEAVRFTVVEEGTMIASGARVESLAYTCPTNSGCFITITTTFNNPIPIVRNIFSTTTLSGEFVTPTSAIGTISRSSIPLPPPAGCCSNTVWLYREYNASYQGRAELPAASALERLEAALRRSEALIPGRRYLDRTTGTLFELEPGADGGLESIREDRCREPADP